MSYECILGDCLEVMKTLPENSIDSIVCDPPYMIDFMGKAFDTSKNNIAASVELWAEALRVAKPGAMLLAFGGTRTHHRLMCAIEDAGWEIRDVCMWLYSQGFPKSLDIGKQLDRMAGAEREVIGTKRHPWKGMGNDILGTDNRIEGPDGYVTSVVTAPATDAARTWDGWGTALKPAWEPIILAMKPLDGTYANNALVHGVAGINVDGCRIGNEQRTQLEAGYIRRGRTDEEVFSTGYGRPKEQFETTQGRWPANLILDEEAAALLDEQTGSLTSGGGNKSRKGNTAHNNCYGTYNVPPPDVRDIDTGGASRFFQIVKDDKYCSLCDLPCNANFAIKSSNPSDQSNGFVAAHVRPLTQPNNAGKSESLPLFADNAESTSTPTLETDRYSVQENAALTAIEQNVLNVKSAGSLCDSCATSIVAALVALQQAQSPELILGQAFMPERTKQILTRCLAAFVALLGSTDTILTMESLSLLFGCVRDAIQSSIPTNETANVSGQTSRLIYQSKASSSERNEGLQGMEKHEGPIHLDGGPWKENKMAKNGEQQRIPRANFHPTVKPIELMRYLCRLTKTPFGGTVLDPFMGSGSTGCAAVLEGRSFVGIEISEEYHAIAAKRIQDAAAQPFLLEIA